MELNGKQIIKGKYSPVGVSSFFAYSPERKMHLPDRFWEATSGQVGEACFAAQEAFLPYAQTADEQRAVFLEQIAVGIEGLGDTLLQRANLETGLPLARLQGERLRTTGQLRFFAEMLKSGKWNSPIIDKATPERVPLPKPALILKHVPLGPVAIFGASNFPLAFSVAGGDTASALAAGCPVVFKGHPAHPGTCELIANVIIEAAHQTAIPNGVFALLQGASHAVGSYLVQHPAIAAVAFTGSFAGGKALFDLAVRRHVPIPVYAEMGSINPIFFLPEKIATNPEALANKFAGSVTLGCGQFCTNPGFFVIQEGPHTRTFINALERMLCQTPVHAMLTPAIEKNYTVGIERLEACCDDTTHYSTNDGIVPRLFTISYEKALNYWHQITEEIFGPVSVGVIVQSKAQFLEVAHRLQGQLTATIQATEKECVDYKQLLLLLQQKAGRLIFNDFPTGVEVSNAMVHGGPYPATTDSRTTSVGSQAIYRFTRPICLQNFPEMLL